MVEFVTFRKEFTHDDRDENGLSFGTDVPGLNGETIQNAAGVDADLDLVAHMTAVLHLPEGG